MEYELYSLYSRILQMMSNRIQNVKNQEKKKLRAQLTLTYLLPLHLFWMAGGCWVINVAPTRKHTRNIISEYKSAFAPYSSMVSKSYIAKKCMYSFIRCLYRLILSIHSTTIWSFRFYICYVTLMLKTPLMLHTCSNVSVSSSLHLTQHSQCCPAGGANW